MALNIDVSVRVRPFNSREKAHNAGRVITADAAGTVTITDPNPDPNPPCRWSTKSRQAAAEATVKTFEVDRTFNTHSKEDEATKELGPYADQQVVMKQVGEPLLAAALSGRSSVLIAYGALGSGKSYSVLGTSADEGLLPRIMARMLAEKNYKFEFSVCEIYCDLVFDLLTRRDAQPEGGLKVHLTKLSDGSVKHLVSDLSWHPIGSYKEAEALMHSANMHRTVSATKENPCSSRGHVIYNLRTIKEDEQTKKKHVSNIVLVDLVGKNSVSSSMSLSGHQRTEQGHVNKSLLMLQRTLASIANGERAAFRESKLTQVLERHLHEGYVACIAAVSPASSQYEETLATLRFASALKHPDLAPAGGNASDAGSRSPSPLNATTGSAGAAGAGDGRAGSLNNTARRSASPNLGFKPVMVYQAPDGNLHRTMERTSTMVRKEIDELRRKMQTEIDEKQKELNALNAWKRVQAFEVEGKLTTKDPRRK